MPTLSAQGQNTGYTHYIKFTYEDLQRENWRDAGTASDVRKKIAFVRRGAVLTYVTAFATNTVTGANDLSLTCGSGETSTAFLAASDIDGTGVFCNSGSSLTSNKAVFTADGTVWIRIQGSITNLTSGSWIVALKALDTPDIVA
jgi:hypothetical protein